MNCICYCVSLCFASHVEAPIKGNINSEMALLKAVASCSGVRVRLMGDNHFLGREVT